MSYPEVMTEVTEVPTKNIETDKEPVQHELHRELNAAQDRCDTCGAQAFHLVIVASSTGVPVDLVYCNHHFNKYDKLKERAIYISSQLEKLNVKPSSSSPD